MLLPLLLVYSYCSFTQKMTRELMSTLKMIPILCTDGQGLVENSVHEPATVLKGSGDNNTCPAEQETIRSKSQLCQNISTILAGLVVHDCGGTSGWRRVGYLDMTDPSQSGLAFKNYTSNLRSCGRASAAGCWSTFYNTGGSQYSRVCGRVGGCTLDKAKLSMATTWQE